MPSGIYPRTEKGKAWVASMPIIRNQIDKLKALPEDAREAMLEAFATGTRVKKILAAQGVGCRAFYKWLEEDPVMRAAWEEMKAYRARSYADDAQEAVESVEGVILSTEEIQLRKLRADIKLRLAAVTNPREFGKSPKTVLQVEHLHLTALERINQEDTARRMQVLEATGAAHALPPATPAEVADTALADALAGC